jgi:hypothetical protein
MKNFISKAKQNAEYRKDVYQLFCCELYEKLKDGTVSLDEINNYFLAYNMLDSTEVPNKKSDVKNIYQKLDDNIKHFKNGFK